MCVCVECGEGKTSKLAAHADRECVHLLVFYSSRFAVKIFNSTIIIMKIIICRLAFLAYAFMMVLIYVHMYRGKVRVTR